MIINSISCEKKKENIILIMGPLSNIVLFIIFYLLYRFTMIQNLLIYAAIQLIIGCFNMLPAKSLDGGSLLFNFLLSKLSVEKSEKFMKYISFFTASIFVLFGLIYLKIGQTNLSIFILGIYVFIYTIIKN